jgi:TrmH family RNA methyltransferase
LTTLIQSPQNQHFKRWRKFIASPEKSNCPWISVEGLKQVRELARRQVLELLLYCPDRVSPPKDLLDQARDTVQLPEKLFASVSEVESSQGILGFFAKPYWNWSDIKSHVLYLDRVQDPGNMGTLLRTAAATGIFSVITSPGTVSCFNSKVVRSSAGYLFSVTFLEGESITSLAKRDYRLYAAHPRTGKMIYEISFEPPLALILGSESRGIDPAEILEPAEFVYIPMDSGTDSLNVSVSGSILMYEVLRSKIL